MAIHQVTQIQIEKDDIKHTRKEELVFDDKDLQKDEILLKTENFGFSANNITYAALGHKMGYWGFFPVDDKYGIVPVWGFAKVVASNNASIEPGKRVYGYLPLATHLKAKVEKLNESGFFDGSSSRKSINSVYDHYTFVDKDPAYNPKREEWQANFRPLFMTSFVLGLFVRDNHQQKQILLSSASSKTALGTASILMNQPSRQYKVIGLTSTSNKSFVEGTQCYDAVLTYDEVDKLNQKDTAWLLDFAANGALHQQLHELLGTNLHKISLIGATDWSATNKPSMSKDNTDIFFAPSEVQNRINELGREDFMRQYAAAWQEFAVKISPFMTTEIVKGTYNINQLYLNTLNNQLNTSVLALAQF